MPAVRSELSPGSSAYVDIVQDARSAFDPELHGTIVVVHRQRDVRDASDLGDLLRSGVGREHHPLSIPVEATKDDRTHTGDTTEADGPEVPQRERSPSHSGILQRVPDLIENGFGSRCHLIHLPILERRFRRGAGRFTANVSSWRASV